VEEYRSIRQATLSMGMAYSKAWAIIRRAERELGFPLLNTTTGGSSGGGAALTAEGRAFLERYDRFCALVNAHAQADFEAVFGPAPASQE
jgi:molybdate transport system regulatory protein